LQIEEKRNRKREAQDTTHILEAYEKEDEHSDRLGGGR
jgi:hypothetical protein